MAVAAPPDHPVIPVATPPAAPAIAALRLGPVSLRVHRRAVVVSVVLAVVLAASVAWAISVGDVALPLGDVVAQLAGRGTSRRTALVISTFRLPRVLTGVLVGAALGASGLLLQRLVRNPLASPDILGVSSGAALGAVVAIVMWSLSSAASTACAFAGAVAAMAAVYGLALKRGTSSYRLVLVGIGLTSLLEAMVALVVARAQITDAQRAAVWLTGSLSGRGWEYVVPLSAALAVLVPAALLSARPLRALELGDDCASGIGARVGPARFAVALVAAALAAVATAAAGPVAFVALTAPQVARRLAGGRALALVPAALVGALTMVVSDLVARRMFAPIELPVGIVTGAVGAPYLLWLVLRADARGTGG